MQAPTFTMNDMQAPTFTMRLPAEACLRLVDDAGCAVWVAEGELWITIDGKPQDVIAHPGERLILERNARAVISTFRDATIVVSARCDVRDVGFLLQESNGSRVLTVTTPLGETIGQLGRWLSLGGAPASRPLHTAASLA
jgi:Protein of unknown function (DUF2917)